MPDLSKIAPEKLIRLANTHLNRFRNLLRQDSPRVNKAECQHYVHVWEDVLASKGVWDDMTDAARREISDAAYSLEYNDLLGLTEEDFH